MDFGNVETRASLCEERFRDDDPELGENNYDEAKLSLFKRALRVVVWVVGSVLIFGIVMVILIYGYLYLSLTYGQSPP